MKNLFIDACKILKLHSLLTVPFILYLYFISLIMTRSQNANTEIIVITFIIVAFLLTTCFLSGWFFMVKNALNNFKDINIKGQNSQIDYAFSNLKMFLSGVGEYFIPTTFSLILYISLLGIFMTGIYILGQHLLGDFPLSYNQLKVISTNPQDAGNIINALSQNQITQLSSYSFLFMSAYLFFSFSTMFYFPTLFMSTKNCIKAFIKGFIFTYCNIKTTFILFLFYILSKTILSVLNTLFASNFLLSTVCLLIIVYFAAYWIILVFYAYEQKENYSYHRTNSFREE